VSQSNVKARNVFTARKAFKPFDYPEVIQFKEAIQHSYWLFSEFSFHSDVQDFHVNLNDAERSAITNTLLAISQIEVSVKKFWSTIGDRFPKSEFEQVGITFGESEVRHSDAYSNLLNVLGLNDDFAALLEVPEIQGRVNYLTKYLKGAATHTNEDYTLSLTLFSLFVENVSLFSQFAVIKSFYRHRNMLKDVSNVVQSTQKEEQVHALFGATVINYIKQENPEWFNKEFYTRVRYACRKAFTAECGIIDWIFQNGELPFVSKDSLKELIKHRFNESVKMIGGAEVFPVDAEKLEPLRWFIEEPMTDVSTDFFHKRPSNYTKKNKSFAADELF
jgi:ribonucleoside-diphosphate reductase beta chain